jgi:tetratricopeptide (TPR) repeat protein
MSQTSSPLADRLQAVLGDRYRLERELGAGGMAIVWLAEDVKHRRKVAIKVLRPELAAALGPSRFVREIEIAAQLQHPHILPLLDSGEGDGLAYYVMPYVEGESLRDRVARAGALPLAEALTILRDVADALAYAHRRGVVHRDVKPDNILLSDGHALVMDFGIAKALSDARGEAPMTSVGMAIGTPAYMAPEQAAGDPDVDHRADIYALGCLAYETLGGRPPFTGTTPQQILAAQISRVPEPLASVRSGLPIAVNDAVMRCLGKLPAERFDTATEFRSALDGVSGATDAVGRPAAPGRWYGHPFRVAGQYALVATAILGLTYFLVMQVGLPDWVLRAAIALAVAGLPMVIATGVAERRRAVARATGIVHASTESALRKHLTWQRAATGGGIAFGVLLLAAGVYQALGARGIGPGASLVGAGRLKERDRIVVADFQNRTTDSTLGASLTEAFRIDLAQTPLVSVLSASEAQSALARMGREAGTALDTAVARELALREGAKAYVAGDVSAVGGSYTLVARVVSAEDGAELVALRETATDAAALLPAIDRLSSRLRERMGESLRSIRAGEPLERVTTSSLEALRLFTEANRASSYSRNDEAIRLLKAALAIDSGFAMAWRKLAAVYSNAGAPASLRQEAATRAYQNRDRLPVIERDQATAQYFWSVSFQPDSAERAFKSVLARNPDDPVALNNYGMLLNRISRPADAEPLLRRGIELDSNRSSFYVNLASSLLAQHKVDESARVTDALERHFPSAANMVTTMRLERFGAAGRRDSARQLAEGVLAGVTEPRLRSDLSMALGSIAAAEGRIDEAERRLRDAEAAEAAGGRPQGALDVATVRAFMVLEYRRDTAAAVRIVTEARRRYPLDSVPAVDRPYGGLASIAMELGQYDEARRIAAEWAKATPAEVREARSRLALTEDEIAMRTGRMTPETERRVRVAMDSAPCMQCVWLGAGRIYDQAGRGDSALALFERGVAYPGDADRIWEDGFSLPRAYRRLGELHEQQGNRAKALQYYGLFVELWRNADPDLQPAVRDVKQRMAQLAGEPR